MSLEQEVAEEVASAVAHVAEDVAMVAIENVEVMVEVLLEVEIVRPHEVETAEATVRLGVAAAMVALGEAATAAEIGVVAAMVALGEVDTVAEAEAAGEDMNSAVHTDLLCCRPRHPILFPAHLLRF